MAATRIEETVLVLYQLSYGFTPTGLEPATDRLHVVPSAFAAIT
jgi:hypothetical protein